MNKINFIELAVTIFYDKVKLHTEATGDLCNMIALAVISVLGILASCTAYPAVTVVSCQPIRDIW